MLISAIQIKCGFTLKFVFEIFNSLRHENQKNKPVQYNSFILKGFLIYSDVGLELQLHYCGS